MLLDSGQDCPSCEDRQTVRRHRIQQVRARTERYEGDWDAPASPAVPRQINEAFAAAFAPKPQAAAPDTEALPEVSGVWRAWRPGRRRRPACG